MNASIILPEKARLFAVEVVKKLREAGYEALWAGGCVRDQLMGRVPKDYDIATNAKPEQICELFGRRRTLSMGVAFGVMTVLGPKEAGQIEIATFRQDADYSDGRHPDHVTFTNAEEDAQRRDFTINGLFFDPIDSQVIDYVGGQEDLKRKLLRAIGDPYERIAEDKLRMLRAIRFAAVLGFTLDQATFEAVSRQASEIIIVSAERVAAEMRLMLANSNRSQAAEDLRRSGLLEVLLPEVKVILPDNGGDELSTDSPWGRTLRVLESLNKPIFAAALAALLREFCHPTSSHDHLAEPIGRRWRLATSEIMSVDRLLFNEQAIRRAREIPWPQLQRILTAKEADVLLDYAEAVAVVNDGEIGAVEYCREKLALPPELLNPEPLISGEDLKMMEIPPGPVFRQILVAVRDAQLEQEVSDRGAALDLAGQYWRNLERKGPST